MPFIRWQLYKLVGRHVLQPADLVRTASELQWERPARGAGQFTIVQPGVSPLGTLVGYVAQEYQEKRLHFDEDKIESKERSSAYEKYLFLLFGDGRLILQRKKTDFIKWSDVEHRSLELIRLLINKHHQTFVPEFTKVGFRFPREYVLRQFDEAPYSVAELSVSDFNLSLLRQLGNYKFFNPHEQFDEALLHGLELAGKQLKSANLKAKGGESLRKNPLARGVSRMADSMKVTLRKGTEVTQVRTGALSSIETFVESLDDPSQVSEVVQNHLEEVIPMATSRSRKGRKGNGV